MDETFDKIILPAIDGFKSGVKSRRIKDVTSLVRDFYPDPIPGRIIITGAGPSLKLLRRNYNVLSGDFIVANQSTALPLSESSIFPNLVIQADPQKAASDKIRGYLDSAKGPPPIFAFSTMTDWASSNVKPQNSSFFKSFIVNFDGTNRLADCWNAFISIFDPEVTTFVMQAGSVVNAAVLLIAHLVDLGALRFAKGAPKAMYFAGVDFSLDDETSDPDDPNQFVIGGFRTTPALLSYYKDLKLIAGSLKPQGWSFFTMTEGLLEDFMTFDPGYKE